jgi:hypothetical protein
MKNCYPKQVKHSSMRNAFKRYDSLVYIEKQEAVGVCTLPYECIEPTFVVTSINIVYWDLEKNVHNYSGNRL